MNSNFIKKETAICEYACDRYYIVDYNHRGFSNYYHFYYLSCND